MSSLSATAELERRAWLKRLLAGAIVGAILGAVLGALLFGSLRSERTATAFLRITPPVDLTALAGGADQTTPDPQDVTEQYVTGEVAYLSGEGFAQAVGLKLAESSPASIVVAQAGGSSVVTISNSSRTADEARRTVQAAIDIYGTHLAQRVDQQLRAILPTLDRWQLADAADGQRLAEIAKLREGLLLQAAQASVVTVLQPPTVDAPGLTRWLIGALLGGVLGAALVVLAVMRRTRRAGQPELVAQLSEAVDAVIGPAVNLRATEGPEQAALARTLYTQCVAAGSHRAIVLIGASAESGTTAIATMFELAASERGPVTRVDAGEGTTLPASNPDATLIVDAGAFGASALVQRAIELASVLVVVARIDYDTTANAVTASAAAQSGTAPVLGAFTYQPSWDTWRAGLARSPRRHGG